MSQKTFTSIPVVDISGLYSEDPKQRKSVADALGKASRDIGFLYVSGHKIDDSYIEGLYSAAKDFFSLPYEEKMKYYIGLSKSHKGFVPEGEESYTKGPQNRLPDHKEAFDVGFEVPADHPLVKNETPLVGPNTWPDIPQFRERVQGYYDQVFALGNVLRRGFATALGLEETAFDDLVSYPPSKMRMIHYPYDEDAVDAPGIGEHTDYEWFTLLLADAPGLEVLNDRGEWIDAPPIPGTIVVNIGDVLEIMTAGKFTATAHRVRSVKEDRFSFPLFYSCDYHTEVKPLPQFADKSTSDYTAMTVGDHIWSQGLQVFKYLKTKVSNGELRMPENSRGIATFGNFNKTAKV